MDGDGDLARLIPEPPPPRPGRRDAAIAMAMRRFDGLPEPAPTARPAASGWRARRGQIGAFASVLIVALIGIPIALQPPDRPLADPETAPIAGPAATPGPVGVEASGPMPSAPAERDRATPALARAPATAELAMPAPNVAVTPESPAAAPPPPPEPQPQPRAAARSASPSQAEVIVTGTRLVRPMLDSPSPMTAVNDAMMDEGDSIVVTGSQSKGAASRRGDWNACTVLDPARSLRGCGHLIATGRKGEAGAAATHVSDGLKQAWEGDFDGAIDRFDRAIALQPRLAIAYLNRALAHRRQGELDRAAADLDLAVRHAPHSARGYYHRSLVRQSRGDARGARADLARAKRLDPQYEEIAK